MGSVPSGALGSACGIYYSWKDFKNNPETLPVSIVAYGLLGFGTGMTIWLTAPISIPYIYRNYF